MFRLFKKNKISMKVNDDFSIVTFGSCLSRRVAESYIKMYGGELKASVFHNRSDYFCTQLLKNRETSCELNDLIGKIEGGVVTKSDTIPLILLKNQTYEHVGKHNLDTDNNLFEVAEKGCVDLFVIDNYMDVVGLLFQDESFRKLFFLPDRDITKTIQPYLRGKWCVGEQLPIFIGVKYMGLIVDYLLKYNPKAKVIFIPFPSTTYFKSPEKVERFIEYENIFTHSRCTMLSSLEVKSACQTKHKQHFSDIFYSGCAGAIKSIAGV